MDPYDLTSRSSNTFEEELERVRLGLCHWIRNLKVCDFQYLASSLEVVRVSFEGVTAGLKVKRGER